MRESGGLVALATEKQNQASKMIEYKTIIYEFYITARGNQSRPA